MTQVDTLARLIGYDSQLIIDGLPSEVPEPSTLDSSQIASLSGLFDKGMSSSISIEQEPRSIDYFERICTLPSKEANRNLASRWSYSV